MAEEIKLLPEEVDKNIPQAQLTVDYRPGHWGRTFHLFDRDKREIALREKDAVSLAKKILKVAKEK